MTQRYSLEVLTEDEDLLIDLPGEASFTLTSRVGGNDVLSPACLRRTTSSPNRACEAQRGG